jgi:hypothetical protein
LKIEFVGGSSADSTSPPVNTSRLINLYREPVDLGGLTRFILRDVPGQTQIADLGGAFLRALRWVNGDVYAVRGGLLYLIGADGTFWSLDSVLDDVNTDIAGLAGSVLVVAGGRYYVWDGVSLTQPTGAAFTSFGSVTTLGNYALFTELNGRRIQWSALADAKTFDGLDFATTEARDDNNIRGIVIGGQYWVFKERSIEIWYQTGLATVDAFARLQGGLLDFGLWGFNLVAKARDSAFFVGSDGVVYLTSGSTPVPISTRPVEASIREDEPTHCYYYEQDGHKFCVIRFSDRPAWVFDIATGEWHERASGRTFLPWGAVACVEAQQGKFWVGDISGVISKLEDTKTDDGGTLFRRAISRTLVVNHDWFRGKEFEIEGAYGYQGPVSSDAQIAISFSADGGATFGTERFLDIGRLGEYEQRALVRSFGRFRQLTAQIDITHQFNIPIYADANLEIA